MNGIVLLNQSDAILAARLRSGRLWESDQRSGRRIRMCGMSSNSRGFSGCTPPASKLAWETNASRLQRS